MRQNFNYHTHTYRCGHAQICEDELYVINAARAGFEILGFSDHAPYPDRSKKTDRMDYDQLSDYLSSINALKEKYRDQITVRLGFEMEYFPQYDDYIHNVLAKKAEYLILGQHYPDPSGEFDYAHGRCSKQDLLKYGQLIEQGLHAFPFLYLAHPDYFCAGIYEFDETCQQVTHQICQAAVETSTPLEVNIKLLKRQIRPYADGDHYVYPFRRFWQIASQYPVRCVYGFDAHDPQDFLHVDRIYEIADGILEGIDLDFIKEPLL